MKKHSLSVFVALALVSATAQADLVLEGSSPTPPHSHSSFAQAPDTQAPYAQTHGADDHHTRAPVAISETGSVRAIETAGRSSNGLPRLSITSPALAPSASLTATQPLPQTIAQAAQLSSVTQSGRSTTPVMRAGWANNMPASLALRQIVPAQFEVKTNGVPLNFEASWGGDKPWPEVLNELAQKGGFVSHIDWNRHEVSLAPSLKAPVLSPSTSTVRVVETVSTPVVAPAPSNRVFVTNEPQVRSEVVTRRVESVSTAREVQVQPEIRSEVKREVIVTDRHSKDDLSAARVVRATETQVGIQSNVWVLDPKLTLRENIEVWAQRVGWRVVWQGADYPIIAPATFTGEFSAPNGPVAQIIAAYETSDQPLLASLTTMDRVLHVRNKNYEHQEVVPTSAGEMSPDLYRE